MHFITGSLYAKKKKAAAISTYLDLKKKNHIFIIFFLFFCRLAKNCMICHPTVLHPPQQPKRKLLEHSYSDVRNPKRLGLTLIKYRKDQITNPI